MLDFSLAQITCLLAAAAVAAPMARFLRVGSVLGYLAAGVIIGPFGIGQVFNFYKAQEVLHFAEFGVVLLLFLIGLELRPIRLWGMRNAVFGAGGLQVGMSALLLTVFGFLMDLTWLAAIFVALALSLSSTAFALQVLDERDELKTRHGRLAFSVLLFQDLAVIPLIALVPLFAASGAAATAHMDLWAAGKALLTIIVVVLTGHFALDHCFRFIARAQMKEAMTAAALLTVVGVAAVMQWAGLSASLGAFVAGALLAESSYRHQLEADIKPFEGLLLGLFFTAVGMSLNLQLLVAFPGTVLSLVSVYLLIKTAVLYIVARKQNLQAHAARRMALFICQGGEFAFVLLTAGVRGEVLGAAEANILILVVTVSMLATPLLLIADDFATKHFFKDVASKAFDSLPEAEKHVIIAGMGRFGQIVGRILWARRIGFMALDNDSVQVQTLRRHGITAFFGDASRLEVLEAAQASRARAFVLTIADAELSIRTARLVREHYPDLPIYARARDRGHVHRLMDLGVTIIRREMFLSSLDLTREVLRGLGYSERDVKFTVDTFARHDEKRLVDDYRHYTDLEKLQESARSDAEALAQLFDEDSTERALDVASDKPQSGTSAVKEPA